MRVAFILSVILGGSLLLGGCQDNAQKPAPTVGIVDMPRLVRDSEPGKEARTFLEGMQKDLGSRLAQMQKAVQENPADEKQSQKFQEQYVLFQQKYQTEEQNVTNVLLEHVFRIINSYREQNGLKAIVTTDVAVSYDKSLDVTEKVLEEVNKIKLDYKPVTRDLPKKEAKSEPGAEAAAGSAAAPAPATGAVGSKPETDASKPEPKK